MRIALLTDGIYPYVMGGMQKHSYYLAKFLAREGAQVDLYHYVPEGKKEKIESYFTTEELRNIDVINVPLPSVKPFPGHYIYSNYLYAKRIYAELKKRRPVDFIYAKGFTGWALLQAKKKGEKFAPVGVNFHGLEMFQQPPSFKVMLQLYMLRLPVLYNLRQADYTFSYGGKITTILTNQGIAAQNIIEIPTGIATQWLASNVNLPTSRARSFVFVGRYERRKGVEELGEVLTQLLEEYDFKVHFVGPIPEEKKLKSNKVTYWGTITEQEKIQQLLRNSDVLLCPSHSEGMPNVIMEGMASGLAVIATDVGAVSALVSAETGWLIPGADIEALKKAIVGAIKLSEEELYQKKAASLQLVKATYTWEAVIGTTIKEIKAIVAEARK